MDHSQVESGKKVIPFVILRWALTILLPIIIFLTLSFMVGFILILGSNFLITNPISLPSRCKIVSSSIDIRSSKICELGLFNYKAKNLFHPFERNKFHCRHDYYWASVFKVEYKDYYSSRTQIALSEAPNEALPLYCRPNFGAALLTKYKFKVNESFDCWYTSGISKVRLYQDDLFSCHADKPSTLEMLRRYFILLMTYQHVEGPASCRKASAAKFMKFVLKDDGDVTFLVYQEGKGQLLELGNDSWSGNWVFKFFDLHDDFKVPISATVWTMSILHNMDISSPRWYRSHKASLFTFGLLLFCGLVGY